MFELNVLDSHNQVYGLFDHINEPTIWFRVDSHADLHPPNDFQNSPPQDLDIGNFVLPYIKKKPNLRNVVWVHNEIYSEEFLDGYYEFYYGISKNFNLPCISFIDENFLGFCDKKENLINSVQIKLNVENLNSNIKPYSEKMSWVLDIDCDFFSCSSMAYQYLLQNNLLESPKTKFILNLFNSIKVNDFFEKNVFLNFRESNTLWILRNIPKTKDQIQQLSNIIKEIESMGLYFVDYLNFLWDYHTYPHFISTEENIEYDINILFSKIKQMGLNKNKLQSICVCKSSNDLFTPPNQIDFILEKLLKKIDNYLS